VLTLTLLARVVAERGAGVQRIGDPRLTRFETNAETLLRLVG
jgi:hypothetical protein